MTTFEMVQHYINILKSQPLICGCGDGCCGGGGGGGGGGSGSGGGGGGVGGVISGSTRFLRHHVQSHYCLIRCSAFTVETPWVVC